MFDAEPVLASASETGLHLVSDEQAAILLDNRKDDLEILLGRNDHPAHTLDRLRQEGGDAARSGGANGLLHVFGAGHTAARVREVQRAAVAVGIDGM